MEEIPDQMQHVNVFLILFVQVLHLVNSRIHQTLKVLFFVELFHKQSKALGQGKSNFVADGENVRLEKLFNYLLVVIFHQELLRKTLNELS